MAFNFVQTAVEVQGTGTSVVITVSPTAQNNLVVVSIGTTNSNDSCTSVTDDKGNTYVLQAVTVSGSGSEQLYQAYGVQVTPGVTAITCHFSGSTDRKDCGADEYSGGAHTNASVFDKSTVASGFTGGSFNTSISPTNAGELVVASQTNSSGLVPTPSAGYTIATVGASGFRAASEYKLNATTSETPGFSVSASPAYAIRATAFLPAPPVVKSAFFMAAAH